MMKKTALALAAGIAWANTRPASAPTDETIVVSMAVGVGVAFFLACLLESKLREIRALNRFEPLGGAPKQTRCRPGE